MKINTFEQAVGVIRERHADTIAERGSALADEGYLTDAWIVIGFQPAPEPEPGEIQIVDLDGGGLVFAVDRETGDVDALQFWEVAEDLADATPIKFSDPSRVG